MAENILRGYRPPSQPSHRYLNSVTVCTSGSKGMSIMSFLSKPKEGGISFYATITAFKSRSESTDITLAEAESIVEALDEFMPRVQDKGEKDYCLRVLADVCRRHVILPKSYRMYTVEGGEKWIRGGVADIWTGKLKERDVCIKVFRRHEDEHQRRLQGAFYYLAVQWKNILHPNVLSFLGVSGSEIVSPFGLITPRMVNNIKDYTTKHQGANRLLLLGDAACGIKHLHSLGIVHGSVNPGNILITRKGTACVGDFGIAGIISDPLVVAQTGTTTRQHGGIRYMAPERLEQSVTEKESDVHSFAMTAYEVLVGTEPFHGVTGEVQLCVQITGGTRPSRPENEATVRWLSDAIWGMLESCWTYDLSARPTIEEVHRVFQGPLLVRLLDLVLPRTVGGTATVKSHPKTSR